MTTEAFIIKEKLAALEAALLSNSPDMPTILQTIHRTLKSQPQTVTLLDDNDIRVIVNGLEKQQGVMIASSMVKKSTSKADKDAVRNASLKDLFG